MTKLNNFTKFLTFYCLILTAAVKADFPTDPQPCKFKDTECLTGRINYFVNNKFAGDSSLNLPEIDPLMVPLVHIKTDPNSALNIDLQLKNNIITGLKDAELTKISGFGPDMTETHELVFLVKQFRMKGDYTVNGKVIILPVAGSGEHDFNADYVIFTARFNGTPQQRDGATYMTIQNMSGTINAKHVTYKFENLIKDKFLSGTINSFINDNWLDIWEQIRGSLAEGLQPTVQNLLNDVFATRPYNEFFA